MYKILLALRFIGYFLIGMAFNKHDIDLIYVVLLGVVMEFTFLINYFVDKSKVSKKTKRKVNKMTNNIKFKIK